MAPKTKRRQQSAKAAAVGRESQKKKRESLDQQPSTSQDQDQTVSGAAPTQSGSSGMNGPQIFACYCDRVLGHRYLLRLKIFTGPFLPLDPSIWFC